MTLSNWIKNRVQVPTNKQQQLNCLNLIMAVVAQEDTSLPLNSHQSNRLALLEEIFLQRLSLLQVMLSYSVMIQKLMDQFNTKFLQPNSRSCQFPRSQLRILFLLRLWLPCLCFLLCQRPWAMKVWRKMLQMRKQKELWYVTLLQSTLSGSQNEGLYKVSKNETWNFQSNQGSSLLEDFTQTNNPTMQDR